MAFDDAAFWNSCPAISASTATFFLDDHLLVWPSTSGPGSLDRAGSVVARFMTGEATVAELAEDFAHAAEISVEDSRRLVADLVTKLHHAGIIEPLAVLVTTAGTDVDRDGSQVAGRESDEVGASETTESLPADLEDAFTRADGSRVVVENLPDGRKRVSTQFTIDSSADGEQSRLASEVLAGNRSMAELAPPDSCLGFKLRIGTDVEVVSINLDGTALSVRCNHAPTTEALREAFTDRLVIEEGPVAAFVVAPLEGEGPCRVFDALGARRGRPRSVEEYLSLVEHLLSERLNERTGAATLIRWGALVRDDTAVLVDPILLGQPRVGAAARRKGMTMLDVRSALLEDGTLNLTPATLVDIPDTPARVAGILLGDAEEFPGDDAPPVRPGPYSVEALLTGKVIDDVDERNRVLRTAAGLVADALLEVSPDRSPELTITTAGALLASR